MTAQPQENRYEVKIWVGDEDPRTGQMFFRNAGGQKFASFEEANNLARIQLEEKDVLGVTILEDGFKNLCYGVDADTESPSGFVVGWMIVTGPQRPRHIHPGQWDPPEECFERLRAKNPQEWEQIERKTRGKSRRCYILVQLTTGLKTVEEVGGAPSKRHKYTPDFFLLGRKMVKKVCDFCQQSFWFPYGEQAGRHGYQACEKHCHLL